MKSMNVAIIGDKFMGKAHSNAWRQAGLFFDIPITPVLKVACGRNAGQLKEFAARWGWAEVETDWKKVIARKDIDIVDVSTPTYLHHDMVIAAAKAGKHIFCEKPMALSYAEAKEMYAAVEKGAGTHYINFNYRRCPAIVLARQLIEQGKVGRIYHWRGCYLQSWIMDPSFPLTWHLRKETAGAGPHYDLNSHSVDLARFLVGEIRSVSATSASFITERPLPDESVARTFQAGSKGTEKGPVTVEDALFMTVEFENGALGAFEASRFAGGRKNFNYFEIYGSKGSIAFNMERMNELELYSEEEPDGERGFRTILATEPVHRYISNWWPPGHTIGYEHEHVHAVVDFLKAIDSGTEIRPNLQDGLKATQVLEAGLVSAKQGKKVLVSEVR
jgi:predicted dehydrogenase